MDFKISSHHHQCPSGTLENPRQHPRATVNMVGVNMAQSQWRFLEHNSCLMRACSRNTS